MQIKNSPVRYGAGPQFVHWLTALLIVTNWLLGRFGDVLPKGQARDFGFLMHMTIGECVIALLVVRVIWRWVNPPPPPEKTPLGRLLEMAARLGHFILYALLILVPFLGIVAELKFDGNLPVFVLWDFASPWPVDRTLARSLIRVHYYLANALLILAFIHANAALVHHWIWRDRTLKRMLPGAA